MRTAAALALLGLCSARVTSADLGNSTIVTTSYSQLQGVEDTNVAGVTVFKGIPFAASTAGEARWTAPQPPASWDGVKVADTFGMVCPQSGVSTDTMSEDCLNLNVWTSADSVDDALPVYVFGGQGLVVVTLNYRMGALGFLATPELQSESPNNSTGNYGLLDQILALKWVQENVAAFGGDPTKVTIGGQSAGSSSVYHLVDSPLAAGLFRGAIAESGIRFPYDPLIWALATSYRTLQHALDGGATYMADHNVSTAAELRNLSIDSIMDGNNDNDEYGATADTDASSEPPLFRPALDGYVMTQTYWEALETGPANDVALITGNNADESGAATTTNVTVAEYVAAATTKYGDLVDEYLTLYPASTDDEANNMTNNAARDISRVGIWLFGNYWAETASSPFYTYYWSHAPPGQTAGAYHMSEINYCFDNLYDTDSPWEADDYAIADVMSTYWANFVKNLDPNGGNVTYWPASVASSNTTMHLDVTQEVMEIATADKIEFIKKYFAAQTPY
ncbi:hypothetical protein PF010_g26028 [Phytophthora fragariae]|uniref:Carboxylic ester hydrolase n=1 Tax=Phytophthora fragariae TaxID=53985 RepID=A0A6G0JYV7_9STRA|nr:hypothetical protein PF010_g26028 [Phytophthora fragariae]KAE9178419.1 hypothetical protein PF004_g25496 [Phytophthora fragariae]